MSTNCDKMCYEEFKECIEMMKKQNYGIVQRPNICFDAMKMCYKICRETDFFLKRPWY